ncbi:MAG TPA: CGNR zinc finger domain-containing protein [Streptosporangiaceae bacterium]|nr:CGNR zinc finger domain-containing protein [Streptosporangiaceae bacterium]
MELPSWANPDESRPAPVPLLLVQAFVNTWDAEHGTDLLDRAETAGPWLREAGLAATGASLGEPELRQAREVRESLRALLAHNGGGTRPAAEELVPLGALARAGSPKLSVDPAGHILLATEPQTLAGGLAGLLLIVRDAQQQGTWQRLKICRNPECRWAFYDRSPTRRGTWCDMATCGNMIKNRNFRARRKQQPWPPG